jgi:hypothetical protein
MKRIATLAAVIGLMIMPASAFAQESSTCEAYNPQLCTNIHNDASTGSDGTLPFTGLDVALLAVGGGGLLGAGLVIRRLSRNRLN